MGDGRACGKACQFIKPDYDTAEARIHGRMAGNGDEAFFGVIHAMYRARLEPPAEGAQWTGLTTEIAAELLRTGAVDAVSGGCARAGGSVAARSGDRDRPG